MKKITLLATAACLAFAPLAASAGNLAAVGADTLVVAPVAPVVAAGGLSGRGIAIGAAAALGAIALVAIIANNDDDDDSSNSTTTTTN